MNYRIYPYLYHNPTGAEGNTFKEEELSEGRGRRLLGWFHIRLRDEIALHHLVPMKVPSVGHCDCEERSFGKFVASGERQILHEHRSGSSRGRGGGDGRQLEGEGGVRETCDVM